MPGVTPSRSILVVLALCRVGVDPVSALAIGNDVLRLRADAGLIYNSNVLGVTDDLPPGLAQPRRQKDSLIQEYGAGLRLAFPVSLQKIEVDAEVRRTIYSEFPELDFTGYAGAGAWDWRAGSDWSGSVRAHAEQSRQVSSSGRAINVPFLVRDYDASAEARYQLTARWEAVGSLAASWFRYDAEEARAGDRNTTFQSIGTLYRSPAGNATGWRASFEQGEWPNADAQGTRSYDQTTLAGVVDWGAGGRSRLSGDLGYTWHRADRAAGGGDDAGVSGRLGYSYSISAKTQVDAAVYSLFGPLDDAEASSVRTRGVDFGLTYLATAKISMTAYASWKRLDYLGEPDTQREDEYEALGLAAAYAMTRSLTLSLGSTYESRDSNLPFTAYDVYTVYMRARLEF